MGYENLTLDREEGIALLTINRPQVRNALDPATWGEIDAALQALSADEETHVLIITGAGDKAFAAGADLNWLRQRSMLVTLEGRVQRVLERLEKMAQPSIAAVNGYALGGGCELALACDLRIASEQARFGQPELRLGILPGGGGTQRLQRLVGIAKAKELIYLGELVDAAEAARIGLVNQVVPHDELLETATGMARKMIERGPLALRLAKVAINAGSDYGLPAGYLVELLAQTVIFATEDRLEGISAFLEKRDPRFTGR
jgi:enoyl-CoA hydratase